VHPDKIFRKAGARAGDVLLLSKPIGTGLTLACGTEADKRVAIDGMTTINRAAAEALRGLDGAVHAVTDVTGYGLAGHSWEMAERSGARAVVDTAGIVAYPGALEAANEGRRTGGDPRNREYLAGHLDSTASAGPEALCFDPQTSGGLLAAVDATAATELESQGFWRVGTVESGDARLVLR
jgi:selenide,water dikinase